MAGKPIRIAILADGGKAKQEFKGVAKEAESSFGKLGDIASKAKLPLVAAAAGLAVGFASAFTDALDMQDATAKLTAQLGLSNAQSEKAGKLAGDLYKDAFGESIQEVNDVLATVFQSGLANIGDSEDKIKGVAEQVFNYAKISGEEALPVTRAISQMLKTGLAKNATEAFDILTKGQQLGINKSEDLLDTFNEYGTQFRKIGIDGPTALGLMNQAIKAGARDSDIAADAIKEFAIRAVDGSATTADGFKSLGLSADTMAEKFAKGGPKATEALGQVLDKLRAVKDPAEQSRIAVELFGTQAEDLGAALLAMDPTTAVKGLGQLKDAAKRAGDVLNDTASTKLTGLGRTIKQSVVDAIAKYALPQLEKFADWFAGRGKLDVAAWAIGAASAIVGFADKSLGAVEALLPALAKAGKIGTIWAAAMIAPFDPKRAKQILDMGDSMDQFAEDAKAGIEQARTTLQGWNTDLAKAQTKVEIQADIEDLDQKLAKAQAELRDPGLTKERRATLTANIAQLTKQKDAALIKLQDPNLIKTRTAKLAADKRDADAKIAANLKALANPALTATKRASLQAENKQLIQKSREAQAQINALKGKTVPITVKLSYVGGALKGQPGDTSLGGIFPGRATGGSVLSGRTYLVGENGPELLTLGTTSGYVTNNRLTQDAVNGRGTAPTDALGVAVYVEIDGQQLQGRITRTVRDENRNLKRKVRQG